MENNIQENSNNNVNINLTNNEKQKPEKKGLPIYIVPTLIVFIICVIGGIFLSSLDFSSNEETNTPSDDIITSTKQDDKENEITTPNDEMTSQPEINNPTEDTETILPPEEETTPNETPSEDSVNTESNTGTQSE